MSRSTPDPVFAAAARAEVERRVRLSSGSAERSVRRPWVMELTAIAGVAAIVGGVAFGIGALRPVFDPAEVPAGTVTQSAAPTADPSPVVTDSPTAVPTGTPTGTPTGAATTPPPVAVTTPPTTPPTSSTPTTPPPATSSVLIGPSGAKERSGAEIRAWALSIGSGAIWAEQAVLDTACMKDAGFIWDPEFNYHSGLAAEHAGMTDAQAEAYDVAEDGPQTDLPYDWRTAGCHGRSVHVTGQDDAH
jgi:hypothetical protein